MRHRGTETRTVRPRTRLHLPGCDAAFYDTEAHHGLADWKHNGQTNIDDLTLGLQPRQPDDRRHRLDHPTPP